MAQDLSTTPRRAALLALALTATLVLTLLVEMRSSGQADAGGGAALDGSGARADGADGTADAGGAATTSGMAFTIRPQAATIAAWLWSPCSLLGTMSTVYDGSPTISTR